VADEYAAKPRIEIGGNALAPEIELRLERAVVDDDAFLPDMVVLRFRDPDRDLLEKAGFEIGAIVKVLAAPQGQEASEPMITAEVTALEADVDPANQASLGLFCSAGFRPCGTHNGFQMLRWEQ